MGRSGEGKIEDPFDSERIEGPEEDDLKASIRKHTAGSSHALKKASSVSKKSISKSKSKNISSVDSELMEDVRWTEDYEGRSDYLIERTVLFKTDEDTVSY